MNTPLSWQDKPESTILTEGILDDYLQNILFCPSQKDQESIGVEFETFMVTKTQNHLRGILNDPPHTFSHTLADYARKQSWTFLTETQKNQHDLILGYELDGRGLITFEPGKQLEISTACFDDFGTLKQVTEGILREIESPLAEEGLSLLAMGIYPFARQPKVGTAESRLIHAKPRYRSMATYYESKGDWGELLMKHTCAIQVCCDNGQTSEEVAERYVLGELLAPYVFASFAYSPICHEQWGTMLCSRAAIIRNHDPKAAGVHHHLMNVLMDNPQGVHTATDCAEVYKHFLLNSRVLSTRKRLDVPLLNGVTFKQWMEHGIEGDRACLGDLIHQLGTIFPETRAKGFLELRSADSLGDPWRYVPVSYYMGLLLCGSSRQSALKLLKPYARHATSHWQLAQKGLAHQLMADLSQQLMKLAIKGCQHIHGQLGQSLNDSGEISILEAFARHFTFQGRVPAQDLLHHLKQKKVDSHTTDTLPIETFDELQHSWQNIVDNHS